jgi:hypothetical protein
MDKLRGFLRTGIWLFWLLRFARPNGGSALGTEVANFYQLVPACGAHCRLWLRFCLGRYLRYPVCIGKYEDKRQSSQDDEGRQQDNDERYYAYRTRLAPWRESEFVDSRVEART